MKKILLSLIVVASGFLAQSQVICAGVSPANIAANYTFAVQTDIGWPRYAANPFAPAGEYWGLAMDFAIQGSFVLDTLVLVNDGTPGTSVEYGHLNAEEGCFPSPLGAYDGKIAVLRRGACNFTAKAKYAQDAGAVAVIVVDHFDDSNLENNYMSSSATDVDGPLVTIPVVRISKTNGNNLIAEMQSGPVVMFIGNKLGAFPNDLGSDPGATLISPYGGAIDLIDNAFDLGIEVYNYGQNVQSAVTVTANIDGPSGNVYNNVINAPVMNPGDTLSIFNGNTYAFPPFDLGGIGNYPPGGYTLTYTIDLGIADDAIYDNVFTSTFTVNPDVISLSSIDGSNIPTANSYPGNTLSEYQSCMFFVDSSASSLAFEGVYFVPHMDTASQLVGEEILILAYEWNDPWINLADPAYVGGANNDWFQNLNLVVFETYYPTSAAENDSTIYVELAAPYLLVDNQRYLICMQTFNPSVAFGYDNQLNYDANQGISAMPISPVAVETSTAPGVLTWFTAGWNGSSAASIGLKVFDSALLGLSDVVNINGMAYPNPAQDVVTISVDANGSADLTITDISGKVVARNSITLVNGNFDINISSLEEGIYIFNVALENGQTSQFNVIKN